MGKTSSDRKKTLTIVILGEGGVGKSSITLKWIKDEFYESYDPTIDDSYITTVTVDNETWQIEVIDTAGQEEYRGLWVEHAVTQGEAFIITYAIDSIQSFRAVPGYLDQIANPKAGDSGWRSRQDASSGLGLKPRNYPFPFVLCGNKVDLSGTRTVPTSEGMQLASAAGGLFYETSAKAAINITETFVELIRATNKLRQAAENHRKNSKTNHRFIPNIGYQAPSLSENNKDTVAGSPQSPSFKTSFFPIAHRNSEALARPTPGNTAAESPHSPSFKTPFFPIAHRNSEALARPAPGNTASASPWTGSSTRIIPVQPPLDRYNESSVAPQTQQSELPANKRCCNQCNVV